MEQPSVAAAAGSTGEDRQQQQQQPRCHSSLSAGPQQSADEEQCWICLCGDDELLSPCSCPRKVHKRCLGRWQLQQIGKTEEKECRFCGSVLPLWVHNIAPSAVKPAPEALINVHGPDGSQHRIPLRPGLAGRREFTRRVRQVLCLPDYMAVTFNFEVAVPGLGDAHRISTNDFTVVSKLASINAGLRNHQQQGAEAGTPPPLAHRPAGKAGHGHPREGAEGGGGGDDDAARVPEVPRQSGLAGVQEEEEVDEGGEEDDDSASSSGSSGGSDDIGDDGHGDVCWHGHSTGVQHGYRAAAAGAHHSAAALGALPRARPAAPASPLPPPPRPLEHQASGCFETIPFCDLPSLRPRPSATKASSPPCCAAPLSPPFPGAASGSGATSRGGGSPLGGTVLLAAPAPLRISSTIAHGIILRGRGLSRPRGSSGGGHPQELLRVAQRPRRGTGSCQPPNPSSPHSPAPDSPRASSSSSSASPLSSVRLPGGHKDASTARLHGPSPMSAHHGHHHHGHGHSPKQQQQQLAYHRCTQYAAVDGGYYCEPGCGYGQAVPEAVEGSGCCGQHQQHPCCCPLFGHHHAGQGYGCPQGHAFPPAAYHPHVAGRHHDHEYQYQMGACYGGPGPAHSDPHCHGSHTMVPHGPWAHLAPPAPGDMLHHHHHVHNPYHYVPQPAFSS